MRFLFKFSGVLLGFALLAGPTLAVDSTVASLPFLKKMQLAKAGDPDAKMAVAEAYETGNEAKLDLAKAAKWYREAALVGNLEAQFRLARIVSKGAPGLSADKSTSLKTTTVCRGVRTCGIAKFARFDAPKWRRSCQRRESRRRLVSQSCKSKICNC